MNAQLRRVYLRGFLEKTAQWNMVQWRAADWAEQEKLAREAAEAAAKTNASAKEQSILQDMVTYTAKKARKAREAAEAEVAAQARELQRQRLQSELNAKLPIIEPLGEAHNRSVAAAVKARADQQAAAQARVKANLSSQPTPEIAGINDVAPQVPGRLAAVQKFLADNKKGIGIGAGVVGGGYLALKIKKMLDERRRREEENTASMHPKYAAVRQPRGVSGDLRTVKQSSAVKTADQYTSSLDSVISSVDANRKGQVQLEAERQYFSRVNKERARRQIEEAIAAIREFEDVEKRLKQHLSPEQFNAIKPQVRHRSQSLKNTLGIRKYQYEMENPGLFDRMAVNMFGPKEDAVIKREARKLVANGHVPAVSDPRARSSGAKPDVAPPASGATPDVAPPASGATPDVAPPASGAKPGFKLTENQKVLGIAALLGMGMGGYGAYRAYRAFKPKRREDEEVKQSSAVKTAAPAPGPVPKPELSSLEMGGYGRFGGYGSYRAFKPNPRFNLTEVAPNQKVRGGAALPGLGTGGYGALGGYGAFKPKPEVAPPTPGTNPRFNLTEVAPNQKVRGGTELSRLGRVGTALSGLAGGAALPRLGKDAYRLLRSRPLPRTGAAK